MICVEKVHGQGMKGVGGNNRFQGVIMIHLDEGRVQGQALVKMVMVF
jgi:hypothetical protein